VGRTTHGSLTLYPGLYDGGLSLTGSVSANLEPGLYYLKGGGLSIAGSARAVGKGVVFYIASDSRSGVTISGSASLTITPPSSGVYQGISIFQDRQVSAPFRVEGAAAVHVSGTVYVPAASIDISGSGKATGSELGAPGAQFIARDLSVSGSATLTVIADADNRADDSRCGFLLAGGPPPHPAHAAPLTRADLVPLVQRVIAGWLAAGLDARLAPQLENVVIQVAPLPSAYLGQATPGRIWIDPTAQGLGWFVPSASDPDASDPQGRADLLAVLSHELGRAFGLEDGDGLPRTAWTSAQGVQTLPSPNDPAAPQAAIVVGVPGNAPDPIPGSAARTTNPAISVSPSLLPSPTDTQSELRVLDLVLHSLSEKPAAQGPITLAAPLGTQPTDAPAVDRLLSETEEESIGWMGDRRKGRASSVR
jgi:hypothetical protein